MTLKMHITHEDVSADPRKPERDKEKTLPLNIPILGNIGKCEKYTEPGRCSSRASLLRRMKSSEEDDDLERSFRNLNLIGRRQPHVICLEESDSESDDEEKRKELESTLIAKCPDKIRDVKKGQQRNYIRPYQVSTRHVSQPLQSGGGVTAGRHREQVFQTEIPRPVEEYSSSGNIELEAWMSTLNEKEQQALFSALDLLETDRTPRIVTTDESCHSPDSTYGSASTMSPASIPPSPFSLHSPNPRVDARCSETDSAGESELTPLEAPFQNVNFIYISHHQAPPPRNTDYHAPALVIQPRPLRPDSVQVKEVGLDRSAEVRMKENKLLSDMIVDVELGRALYYLKPLLPGGQLSPGQIDEKKSELRKELNKLIRKGPGAQHFYEQIYVKVKLYVKECKDILMDKQLNPQTPLFIAALEQNEYPLIARFIADVIGKNEVFDSQGNSLLHYLAEKGDSHAQVLAELLNSKAFNVNHKNVRSETALHKAVECHTRTSSLATVKQLIRHGIMMRAQDLYGRTALHIAVSSDQADPGLLRALLTSPTSHEAVNTVDNDINTPLHIAASRSDLSLEKHKAFVSHLINSNARHDIRNKNQKVALALVDEERKRDIRGIIHRKM